MFDTSPVARFMPFRSGRRAPYGDSVPHATISPLWRKAESILTLAKGPTSVKLTENDRSCLVTALDVSFSVLATVFFPAFFKSNIINNCS